jgi:AcrR family transcriptional regulator
MARVGRPSKVELSELVTAAARVFAERGYSTSRLEDVAAVLDITKGAIYYHYARKQDLLRDVYLELLGIVIKRASKALASVASPEERIRALVLVHLQVSRDLPDHAATWLQGASYRAAHELRHGDDWREVQSLRVTYERMWIDAIMEYAAADQSVAHILTNLSLGALNWMYVWSRASVGAGSEFDGLAVDYVLSGLRNRFTESLVN